MKNTSNVRKLVAHKMSLDAVPDGGDIGNALGFLRSPERLAESARGSWEWVGTAIGAVRQAAEPNPWKKATDEEIAEEILKKIQENYIKMGIPGP